MLCPPVQSSACNYSCVPPEELGASGLKECIVARAANDQMVNRCSRLVALGLREQDTRTMSGVRKERG